MSESDRSNTKYGDRIADHDWSAPTPEVEAADRVYVDGHEVDVIYITDPGETGGYGRERYTATINYDDETGDPYVLFVVKHRWKGNYWRDSLDMDWRDVPGPVRQQIAAVLPVNGPNALDCGHRMIDEGGESRWEKYHKPRMADLDAGEMWGSSFLGDALDMAESAAEAVREHDGDAEPVEQAVEEIQRAITTLNAREGGNQP